MWGVFEKVHKLFTIFLDSSRLFVNHSLQIQILGKGESVSLLRRPLKSSLFVSSQKGEK